MYGKLSRLLLNHFLAKGRQTRAVIPTCKILDQNGKYVDIQILFASFIC